MQSSIHSWLWQSNRSRAAFLRRAVLEELRVLSSLLVLLAVAPASGAEVTIGSRRYAVREDATVVGALYDNEGGGLTVLGDGRFVAHWHGPGSNSDCYATVYSAGLDQVLAGKRLLNPNGTGGWEYGPVVVAKPDNGFWAVFGRNSNAAVLQRFGANLQQAGGEITALNGNCWPAASAAPNGDFVVVGASCSSSWFYAQRFANDGTKRGSPWKVAESTGCWEPAVAHGPGGEFAIAWSSGGNILAQRYSAAGQAVGTTFRVNSSTGGTRTQPSLSYRTDGTATFVWDGPGQEDSQGIYLRSFAPDGQAMGPEQLVNTGTAGNQGRSCIATSPENECVVYWMSGGDVYLRLFDTTGEPFGGDVRVNRYTAGSQSTVGYGGRRGVVFTGPVIFCMWHGDGTQGAGVYRAVFTEIQVLFRRGDWNQSGAVDVADAVGLLGYLYADGSEQPCSSSGDADDNGHLNLNDAVAILNHVFGIAASLPPPFSICDKDPTADGLTCARYEPCL